MKQRFLPLWMLTLLLVSSLTLTSCVDNTDNIGTSDPKSFFSDEINKLIDDNYKLVAANGYAELTIPAALYDQKIYDIDPTHRSAMDCLAKAGYKTYVNGGAVRDGIMGTQVHDVDFSTDATPEEMVAIVPNSKIELAGSMTIVKAYHENGEVTDMVPMHGIDSRLSGKPGIPESPYTGQLYSKILLDDTYTRDLTINSMYYDYQTGNLIDYHGGLHDLRDKIIRTVYDANIMFPINPSAIIRTVRFAARYGFEIDSYTKQAIQTNMKYCDELSASLVSYYIMKGFNDGCGSRTYAYYLDNGLLDHYVVAMKDYLHKKDYQDWLFPVLGYYDEVGNSSAPVVYAALFLPELRRILGTQETTLENITTAWDKIETESGQKQHFEVSDYSGDRTQLLAIWNLYFQMIAQETREDAELVKAIRSNESFSLAQRLINGLAKSESDMVAIANFWN